MTSPLVLLTADGVELEAELERADSQEARVVLCHPHPLQGGSMRSLVISELFSALPAAGVTSLRFNFRGVGASTGDHNDGDAERKDVIAAIDAISRIDRDIPSPVVVVGWSFGADIVLSQPDDRLTGWVAIAPPFRFARDLGSTGVDPRPKLIIFGERDEISPPAAGAALVADWAACTLEVVPGASHFFVGRTSQLAALVVRWIGGLARG